MYYNVKKEFTKQTCGRKCEKKGKKMNEVNKENMPTKFNRVILASSSEIRIKILNKYFSKVEKVSHKIDEKKFKTPGKKPEEIVLTIARKKALSVIEDYSDDIVIASDQILVCENKILSKPKTLEAAKKKLLFLRNKTHQLYSSIYVMKKRRFYFQQVKKASIFVKNLSQRDIESYVKTNHKTVINTVGSYKIEENPRYKFIRVINGDLETILGFPIKDLIEKIKHEK